MVRLRRTARLGAVMIGLLAALFVAGAGSATAALWVNRADIVYGGWGESPTRPYATYTSILINRDFTSTSGLGRTIGVFLEMSETHCDKSANDLVTIAQGNPVAMVGAPSDLVLTTTSAHYSGKVSLRETRIVSHDCVNPGPPVITTRDLGTVQITADWSIGRRARVHDCTYYATPPPPIVALRVGWRSDDLQGTMTLTGAVTRSLFPPTQYTASALSTSTLGGIPAPRRPPACIEG